MSVEIGVIAPSEPAALVNLGSVVSGGEPVALTIAAVNTSNPTDPANDTQFLFASASSATPLFMLTPQQPNITLEVDPDELWAQVNGADNALQLLSVS